MYKQGQFGAPPPMLIPIILFSSFSMVTLPEVIRIPLKSMSIKSNQIKSNYTTHKHWLNLSTHILSSSNKKSSSSS